VSRATKGHLSAILNLRSLTCGRRRSAVAMDGFWTESVHITSYSLNTRWVSASRTSSPGSYSTMQIDRDFALAKIRSPREVVGIPLGKSRLRSRFRITAVAVKRSDRQFHLCIR
jgi:hypothetical protein